MAQWAGCALSDFGHRFRVCHVCLAAASLVGLEWREKNYMGVVYTTNDDGKCDPLDAKHIFIFPYGAIIFWGTSH